MDEQVTRDDTVTPRRRGVGRAVAALALLTGLLLGTGGASFANHQFGDDMLFLPAVAFSFMQGFVIPNCQASAINVEPRYAGAGSGLVGFIGMAASAAVAQVVAEVADGTVRPMLYFTVGAALAGVISLPLIRKAPAPAVQSETA